MTRTFMDFYEDFLEDRMEILFGFIGLIIMTVLIITSLLLTPNYNWISDTVSSLGQKDARFFFSIGFVIGGSLGIPFFIFLDKSVLSNFDYIEDNVLMTIRKPIRRFTTAAAVITCVSIALVGILPDDTYPNLFSNFHNTVAGISFFGTSVYIFAYSILLFKQQLYETTVFSRFHPILGFIIFAAMVIMLPVLSLLDNFPIGEWILTILLFIWLLLTSSHLLFNKEIQVILKAPYPKKLEKELLKYERNHSNQIRKLANMYQNIGTVQIRWENKELAEIYLKKAINEFNKLGEMKFEKTIESLQKQLDSLKSP